MFKSFLSKTYVQLLVSSFNVDMPMMYLVFISKLFVSQIILSKHMLFVCERIFLSWFLFFELAWAVLRLLASTYCSIKILITCLSSKQLACVDMNCCMYNLFSRSNLYIVCKKVERLT